jgi:pyruvate-formate lyase-activating enzyme
MLKKVYLEITNVCNLACAFCPGTKREKRFLSEAEFNTLTDALRGRAPYLYFHLMGEPLLHPLLDRFLTIAGEKGFRVILTTNGTLLAKRADELLAAPALHKINLSLQSFEANAGGELESYVNQCAAFAAAAAAAGKLCELRLWNHGGWESLNDQILALLEKHRVRFCGYGHIHGKGIAAAFNGWKGCTEFRLLSADAVDFTPVKLLD